MVRSLKPSRAGMMMGALLLAACEGPPEHIAVEEEEHTASVQGFHDARVAELEAPDSWLALIALHWLEEGETTVGSDPSSDLVLPEGKAAPFVGTAVVQDDVLTFVVAEGVTVTQGVDSTLNLPAGSGAFPPDISGDPVVTSAEMGSAGPGKSKVLRNGDINWIQVRRNGQFALRVRDNSNAVYEAFTGIDRYPITRDWRVTAQWVPHKKTVAVPNVVGTVSERESPAHVAFWLDGEKHTLDVTGDPDAERFMLVFADETSGSTSYGGGRYVWVSAPDEAGRTVLDFNLAYNPPCVWTPFATCPLPSRDNRLSAAVEAGEMEWKR
ncbi:MAG: DUF1684 domain-containing protein [Longimicrobiales bacterium]|jgi:uncharacterized protein